MKNQNHNSAPRKEKPVLLEIIYSNKVILEEVHTGLRIKFDDRMKMIGFVSRMKLASSIKNISCLPLHLQNMCWDRINTAAAL